MGKLSELKAAYEAVPRQDWAYNKNLSAVVYLDKHAVKCAADLGKIDNGEPLGKFISLSHNHMGELLEAAEQRDQLWKALMSISERAGDYTQNLVNDALRDVGFYKEEDEDDDTENASAAGQSVATEAEYVAKHGCVCPCCGSTSIEGDSVEIDRGSASQKVSCDCGADWIDQYSLTGYSSLSVGDGEGKEE